MKTLAQLKTELSNIDAQILDAQLKVVPKNELKNNAAKIQALNKKAGELEKQIKDFNNA